MTEQDQDDLRVLAAVGRMYLDALDTDPENEMLTLPEAFRVTQVREAVERQERASAPATPAPYYHLADGSPVYMDADGQSRLSDGRLAPEARHVD